MATKMPKIVWEDLNDMLGGTNPPGMNQNNKNDKSSDNNNAIAEMSFDDMKPFPNHRFKPYEGQALEDMIESIRTFGILMPIIVWHKAEGKNIILSGHNRVNAGKAAGLSTAPVIIKENLCMEEAALIVTETNLRQRSFKDMSHSERALCLAQHYEAMKSQGKRTDLIHEIKMLMDTHEIKDNKTLSQFATKLRSDEKLGAKYELSKDKVARYIRISNLIEPLLHRLDEGELGIMSAYELSFIDDKAIQEQIEKAVESGNYRIDGKQAELLREHYKNGKLNQQLIEDILSGEKTKKPKSNKQQPFKLKPTVVSKYFIKGESHKEIEDIIEKALELYYGKYDDAQDKLR